MNTSMKIGSAFALVGALVAWLLIEAIPPAPHEQEPPARGAHRARPRRGRRRRRRAAGRGRAAAARARLNRTTADPTAAPLASRARGGPRGVRSDARRRAAGARRALLAAAARPEARGAPGGRRPARLRPPRDRGLARVRPAPEDRRLPRLGAARLLRRADDARGPARRQGRRPGRVPLPRHAPRDRQRPAPQRRRGQDVRRRVALRTSTPRRRSSTASSTRSCRRGTRRCSPSTTRSTRLEDEILEDADTDQRMRLLEIKHSLVAMRQTVERPARRARRRAATCSRRSPASATARAASRCATSSTACRWSPSRSDNVRESVIERARPLRLRGRERAQPDHQGPHDRRDVLPPDDVRHRASSGRTSAGS